MLTPLMLAAQNGNLECITELMRAGANPLLEAEDGRNSFSFAAEEGRLDCLRALLTDTENNDLNKGSKIESLPLSRAIDNLARTEIYNKKQRELYEKTIIFLIKNEADFNLIISSKYMNGAFNHLMKTDEKFAKSVLKLSEEVCQRKEAEDLLKVSKEENCKVNVEEENPPSNSPEQPDLGKKPIDVVVDREL